tara:strand:+ start:2912 stop:4855 length:1944 start_codon:yes stop_codon:yes gene_type:complete
MVETTPQPSFLDLHGRAQDLVNQQSQASGVILNSKQEELIKDVEKVLGHRLEPNQGEAPLDTGAFLREGADVGFGFGGDALAKLVPPSPAKIPANIILPTLTAAGGRVGTNLLQSLGVPGLGEPSQDIIKETMQASGFNLGGGGVGEILNKFLKRPVLTTLRPGAKEADMHLNEISGGQQSLSLDQLTDHGIVEILANVSRGGFFSSKSLPDNMFKNNKLLHKVLDKEAGNMLRGASPSDASILFKKTLDGSLSMTRGATMEKARNTDAILKLIKNETELLLPDLIIKKADGPFLESSKLLTKDGAPIFKGASTENIISHEQIGEALEALTSLPEGAILRHKNAINRITTLLKNASDTQFKGLDSFMKKNPILKDLPLEGSTLGQWLGDAKLAKKGMRQMATREFRDKSANVFIEKIAKEHSDTVALTLIKDFSDKKGTVTRVRQIIRRAPDGAKAWEAVQGNLAHKLLMTTQKGGRAVDFDAGAIVEQIKKLEDSGVYGEIFKGKKWKDKGETLKKIVNTINLNNLKPSSEIGKFFIQMRQGAMVMGLAGTLGSFAFGETGLGTGLGAGTVAILAGPKAIGNLFTSPTFLKILREGVGLEGQAKIRWMGRVTASLIGQGFDVVKGHDQSLSTSQRSSMQRLTDSPL